MEKYTLNDLESLTGIKTDTIRIWEKRYNILKPQLTSTNRRRYSDDDLMKLINISVLYNNGVKISRIASMPDAEVSEKAAMISEGRNNSDETISKMVVAMNSLDEREVKQLLLNSIIARDFENTFTEVIFPFMQKIGVMWHTGTVNVGTEHFITNIFRRRLIAAIDNLPSLPEKTGKKFLLFLPEGETHELGLLFYYYLIAKNGYPALYLGQSTPFNAVEQVAAEWDPDILITGTISGIQHTKPNELLKQLSAAFPGKMILAGGTLGTAADRENLPNVHSLKNRNDLMSFL